MAKHTGRHVLFKPGERSDFRWLLGQVQNIVAHNTGSVESRELVRRVMAAPDEQILPILSEYVILVNVTTAEVWHNGGILLTAKEEPDGNQTRPDRNTPDRADAL